MIFDQNLGRDLSRDLSFGLWNPGKVSKEIRGNSDYF